ncbi:MAG: DNA polymerase IV [Caulobacteraceae bacterium]
MTALCRDCLALFDEAPARCLACASPRLVAHPELTTLAIAHLDCDAFYASVEKRDRPELRDKAVIVGGEVRGVVTTACYIARLSGVRSAMPMFQARRLCPHAVVIRPDFHKYHAASRQIFDKVRALTPLVQSLSLDEAWIDLSGAERLHRAPNAVTLAKLQQEIERDVGVTVSIGLAPNRFLAKIASDLDKPRGFAVIGASDAERVLAQRPVGILPGVGAVSAETLKEAGYRTVGDLARATPADLQRQFGANGARLWRLAHGQDGRPVNPDQERKSISAETTFPVDLTRLEDLEDRLSPLCDKVARHARADGLAGQVVTLKLRRADFRIFTRRRTLPAPTQTARTLFAESRRLLAAEINGEAYRLVGVGLTALIPAAAEEVELFPDAESRARLSERVADGLRDRFGAQAVVNPRQLRRRSTGRAAK